MHTESFCYIIFGFKSNLLVAGQVGGLKSMCMDLPQGQEDDGHSVNIITDVSGFLSVGPDNLAMMSVAIRQGRRPLLALAADVMSGFPCRAVFDSYMPLFQTAIAAQTYLGAASD